MNSIQLKYIRQRAEAVLSQRSGEVRRKHSTPQIFYQDPDQIRAMLRAGKFTITETSVPAYGRMLRDYITLEGEQTGSSDHLAIAKELAAVRVKFDELMDELILGDNETALKLLREFEHDG